MAVAILSFLQSCGLVTETYDDPSVTENGNGNTVLVLRLNALSKPMAVLEGSNAPVEQVKSLRIIMVDGEGTIEVNEKIDDLNALAMSYIYTFRYVTKSGFKRFYFFANEESAGKIGFQPVPPEDGGTLDEKFYEKFRNYDLTRILDSYAPGNSESAELEEVLAATYIIPTYNVERNEWNPTDPGRIALPYTSYYQLEMEGGTRYEQDMYLVPVATKIDVNFINNRNNPVKLKRLSLISLADRNFLMPHVGTDDYEKDGRFWIDWLAEIARESHDNTEYEDNEKFNDLKGWIADYLLPLKPDYKPANLLMDIEGLEIPGQSASEVGGSQEPGRRSIPTVYFPESRYIPDSDPRMEGQQSYMLELIVEDESSQDGEIVLRRTLSNVKAFFRNTHLVIDVEFAEGYMHVYGEIQDWASDQPVNGYVREEQ